MLTTLEQAIIALQSSKQPVTVRNAIAAYIDAAGFGATDMRAEDAVLAFERALDKHRQSVPEVDRLRRDYWTERGGQCICGRCGSPLVMKAVAEDKSNVPPARRKRKITKKKIVASTRPHSRDSDSSRSSDPYGPSTSATAL